MLNCYRLHLRENILSYSLLRVQEASRGSAALLKNVCLYACVHIEALNWPPVAIHSLTHTPRACAHTHTSFFSLSGTLKEKMCVCVFSSLTFQSTHMHAELSRHVGSCLCRGCVCPSAHYSCCLPVERVGTETNRSVATATHTKEVQEQQESDNLKTCEEETQQVGTGHQDFRNLWVGLEA